MDPNLSLGKICLGEDVVVISSDKVEGSGDWNSSEFQDTATVTKEGNKGFAYDGETNLGVEENMISNEYAVNFFLEYKVKRGNKVVKKELIIALRGEIYFGKFIINPKEDDVEPGVEVRWKKIVKEEEEAWLKGLRDTRSDVMRNAESDSDDEEDYQIKRNKFGAPIYGPKPAPYLNCNKPTE
ncbi:hypothetical protein Tco_0548580 [Tanacetum coccineum]